MAGELVPEILLAAAWTGRLADKSPTPDGTVTGAEPLAADIAPDLGDADRLPRDDGSMPGVELLAQGGHLPCGQIEACPPSVADRPQAARA